MNHVKVAVAMLVAALVLAAPATAAPAAKTIRVTESSYKISLSARPTAGVVTFVVRNTAEEPHDFWLKGGGRTVHTRVLETGETAKLSVRLKKGARYSFWCAVGSHAADGMRGSFVVR